VRALWRLLFQIGHVPVTARVEVSVLDELERRPVHATAPSQTHRASFDDVYLQFAERVYRFCLWQLHDAAVAEDVTSQTFMAAYQAYAKSPPDAAGLQPWLFRIARNLATDHRRREGRRARILDVLGRGHPPAQSVEDVAETNDELSRILGLMARLHDRDRRLIALRAAGELSYRDIGAVLGMSEENASRATRRALEKFRRLSEESS
jgi:RNA polymerase sigma-70 factor (ECF subfamily)